MSDEDSQGDDDYEDEYENEAHEDDDESEESYGYIIPAVGGVMKKGSSGLLDTLGDSLVKGIVKGFEKSLNQPERSHTKEKKERLQLQKEELNYKRDLMKMRYENEIRDEKFKAEQVLQVEKVREMKERRRKAELDNQKKELEIEKLETEIERLKAGPLTQPQFQAQSQAQPQVIYGELPSSPHEPTLESDGNEEFNNFLDYIASKPTSILILGSKGQGKSALGHALLEYIHVRSGKPAVILGAPKEKARLFPKWVRIADDWNEVPEGSIILIDEAGIILFSRNTMSKANKSFGEINAISRQKNLTLIYTSQSSRSVDVNTIYSGETQIIFKKPDQFAIKFERGEVKKLAKDALDLLTTHVDDKTRLKEYSVVYFFSGEGQFLMKNGLSSYWSEDLSRVFSGVTVRSKEQEIRDLHIQGLNQQEIAQRLSMTQGYVSRVLREK